ncbi:hypothetical protein ACFQY4_12105 [Catellatospora bangladeshensis]
MLVHRPGPSAPVSAWTRMLTSATTASRSSSASQPRWASRPAVRRRGGAA